MTRAAAGPETVLGPPSVRPRYGRIAAFGSSTVVCAVAFLGGLGVLPSGGAPAAASGSADDTAALSGAAARTPEPTVGTTPEPSPEPVESGPLPRVPDDATTAAHDPAAFPLPEDSGEGRRVVFDLDEQRVWLVRGDGTVRRTYLASGSVTDNLRAGTYEVYSRSEDATGIDGTSMRWMVRFTRGDNAAIGFHDLPIGDDGRPVQRLGDLGTATSHGCIRQAPGDAQALWRFAPVGTTVVVTGTPPGA